MTASRSLLFGPLALLLVAGLAAGCGGGASSGNAEAAADSRTRVEALRLTPRTFDDAVELTGSVEATDDATLSAQATGTVTYLAERGQTLGRGGVVARLDPTEAEAALEQARAQLEAAEAQYELAQDSYDRQEPLYQDSIISAQEFESIRAQRNQARAQAAQARAGVSQAEERLAKTTVTTPFAGTVEERFVEPGEQISIGQQVVRVLNTRRVKVTGGVPERYANDIERGTPVQVRFPAAGVTRDATVSFVGSAVNAQSRTFPVEVEMDNPEGRIKPEMIASLRVRRQEIEDALVVPRSALIRDEEGVHVYLATATDSADVAQSRDVTLGPSSGNLTVITAGLEAGDRVIVAGQNNISGGTPLNILRLYEDPDAVGQGVSDGASPGAAGATGTAGATAPPVTD